ncbi:uncharacterized protein LOC125850727 [Solanum stenotomum]|uniref:uncharacterized protein LOC125850727 n=1 Tax=Solanum stenotomum TaxID=172797 RepID=UPI0020D19FA8|nr:uncharacterized protein LOC125850727 [Solanum stenotomum]
MAVHAGNEPEKQFIWYVDTGCSNHMTGSKFSFTVLNENFRSIVSFGDLSTVNVMGKGNINFRTKNGCVEIISNVFNVPTLKNNLLSTGQLLEKGYVITLRNDACEISDPSKRVIAFVKMSQNRLFPLKIENVQSCYMAEVRNPSWLWHFRYGHLGFGGLRTLQQKNMVIGLPEIITPSQVCEECVVGKQHRSQFPKGKSWRASSVLELEDLGVYSAEKSEAFNVFKSFKARVENET